MKIYTRTGDKGETGLFGGGRVGKDDPRVDAYGELDEANAVLGMARAAGLPQDLDRLAETAQSGLFDLGAELATPPQAGKGAKERVALVDADAITAMEKAIDGLEEELPALRHFILPGGTAAGAALHLARTVLRRAERRMVALHRAHPLRPEALSWVNRLSDLLFVMARVSNNRGRVPEKVWEPGKG